MAKYKATDKARNEVKALKSFGNRNEDIAIYLGISHDTLTRHYKKELEVAAIEANARVANKLYKKAVEQDDLSARIFWLKTRAKWREKDAEDDGKIPSILEMIFTKLNQ